jgi:sugar lactone lactonase YvrE
MSPCEAQPKEKIPQPKDGIPAVKSTIYGPSGICFDPKGNLFIADTLHHRIRRVESRTGRITTVAGNGTDKYSGDNGRAAKAGLDYPVAVVSDALSNLYVADYSIGRVRKVTPDGTIRTIAGRSESTWEENSSEGDPAIQRSIDRPNALACDSRGNLFILESSRVLRVDALTGKMTTVAGVKDRRGRADRPEPAYQSHLDFPSSMAIDVAGNLFICDQGNYCIRRIDHQSGTIEAIYAGIPPTQTVSGTSTILRPGTAFHSVAVSADNQLYFAENEQVKKMDLSSQRVTVFAGSSKQDLLGDGGPALSAGFGELSAIAIDQSNNIYLADFLGNRIRKINPKTGLIVTFAGNGLPKHPPMVYL